MIDFLINTGLIMSYVNSIINEFQNHPLECAAKAAVGGTIASVASNPIGCELVALGMKRLLPKEMTSPFFENALVQELSPLFPSSDLAALTGLAATWITSNSLGCLGTALTISILSKKALSLSKNLSTTEKYVVGASSFCIAKSPLGPLLLILAILNIIEKIGLYKGLSSPASKAIFAGKCLVSNLAFHLLAKGVSSRIGYLFVALVITGLLISTRIPTVREEEGQVDNFCKDPKKYLATKAIDLLLSGEIQLTQSQMEQALQLVAKSQAVDTACD